MNAVATVWPPELAMAPMTAADIDPVLALEQRIHAFPWTRANFADSLAAAHNAWLLRDEGMLLGYAVMTLVLDEAELLNIGIAPQRQRAGLGGWFLERLMADVRDRGAARIFLEVRPSNLPALALYRRCGFAQVGKRNDYYPAPQGREAALILAREL